MPTHGQRTARRRVGPAGTLLAEASAAALLLAVLVVTHEIGFAREAADTVVFMDGGAVMKTGPPSRMLVDPRHLRTRSFLSKVVQNNPPFTESPVQSSGLSTDAR